MLGERFVVQDCLGGNDRAALYRARDHEAGGELRVVQVLRRDAIGDSAAIRRFVAERAPLLTLLHPNLVTIEDIAVDSATVTIVSEHIVGPDLNRLRHEHGGTLPPALAVELSRQVLLGMSALHAIGLVHTDVRPGSVLVPRIVDPSDARLAGAALGRIGRGGQGRLDRLPRPVAFTAPEVLLGGRPTAASDVYAAGVLLYETLTGRTPFAGTSDLIAGGEIELAPPRPPDVPDELWAILAMMLTKDPADRPSSAVSVADGLGAIAPDFTLLGPAAPMANPDPWSLRPAVTSAQRRSTAGVAAVPAGAPVLANVAMTAPATAPATIAVAAGSTAIPAGSMTPRRRVLVSAGAASVVALGALAGVVTVSGEHKPHEVAATLPFADESYSTGAVVVSRTWSLSTAGDRLHGQVNVTRTAAGGPADVPEWLPSQLAGDQVSASHGVRKQAEAGAAVLQLAAPQSVGRTVTYTYDVDTHGGPATVARLQGWAVNQAVQAAELRADLGQQQPDTVAALSVGTPAVALTSQGVRYSLALVGGDNVGQKASTASLVRTTYASDDPSVAAVNDHGVVQPGHPGTTVVTARLGPLAASATVLVTDPKKHIPLQFVRTTEGLMVVDAKPTTPARPTMVTAHAGNGTALVIWSRPDDGGQPITAYDVYADGRKVATVKDTHTLIRGLDRNHTYRFTVVARNKLGTSTPSPASKPVVPRGTSTNPSGCLPAAPTKLNVSLVGRTTVRVSWQTPSQWGCAVSAVRIQSFPPSRSIVAAPGATSVDIPGLDTATQYDFAVTAAFGQDPPQTSSRSTPVQTTSGPCWDGSYSDPCPVQASGDQTVSAPISSPAPPVAVAVGPVTGAMPLPLPVATQSSPVPASSAPGVIPPTTTPPIETSPPEQATQTPPATTQPPPPTTPTTPPATTEPSTPGTVDTTPPDQSSDSTPPADTSSPTDSAPIPTDNPPS